MYRTMQLAELNARVTEAILRAESLCPGSPEAQSAFREVSALEESIASVTAAGDIEGEIARLGAVSAAIDAGEHLRALQLGRRYADELAGAKVLAKLQQLMDEAERLTPPKRAPAGNDCTCYLDCQADSHSGRWHQHEGEPCPEHPNAPTVG